MKRLTQLTKIILLLNRPRLSSSFSLYSSGLCVDEAWKSTGADANLNCSANDIQTSLVKVDGPNSCQLGETIRVNVTIGIRFPSRRYDFSVYTLSEDNIFGSSCALDALGEREALNSTSFVSDQDGDACYDVETEGEFYLEKFQLQDNLKIPCKTVLNSETETVQVHYCHGWRSKEMNVNCIRYGAIPGSSAQCQCGTVDLGIPLTGGISSQPTKSPTSSPSLKPSIMAPTSAPSAAETSLPCPPPYDPAGYRYIAGDLATYHDRMYECSVSNGRCFQAGYEPGSIYGQEAWNDIGPCVGSLHTRSSRDCPEIFDKYLRTYSAGDKVSSRGIIFECITSNGRCIQDGYEPWSSLWEEAWKIAGECPTRTSSRFLRG